MYCRDLKDHEWKVNDALDELKARHLALIDEERAGHSKRSPVYDALTAIYRMIDGGAVPMQERLI